mgnify:FL=1
MKIKLLRMIFCRQVLYYNYYVSYNAYRCSGIVGQKNYHLIRNKIGKVWEKEIWQQQCNSPVRVELNLTDYSLDDFLQLSNTRCTGKQWKSCVEWLQHDLFLHWLPIIKYYNHDFQIHAPARFSSALNIILSEIAWNLCVYLVTKFGIVTKVNMKMAAAHKSGRFFASSHICVDRVILLYVWCFWHYL